MVCLIALLGLASCPNTPPTEPWPMHTIDDSSRGADGVKMADFDRDGFDDVVTGWEEGGRIRICFQPEDRPDRNQRIRSVWDSVTVGRVSSAEDAVAFDFNRDGWLDVISCCEGATQNVFVHLNPGTSADVRNSSKWTTSALEGAAGVSRWMFATAVDENTLVFGSKNPAGRISVCDLRSGQPKWSTLRNSNWIMSLRVFDVDQDGHADVLYSDRKGAGRQVGWLRNPGDSKQGWTDHLIGGQNREVMFLDVLAERDFANSAWRLACQTKDGGILLFQPTQQITNPWNSTEVARPPGTGSGKGVAFGDLDGDGSVDLVCSCEHAGEKVGVYWMKQTNDRWVFQDISGNQSGTKFDRIELLDVDLDGDLDVVTCEERNNLGVIWYENRLK